MSSLVRAVSERALWVQWGRCVACEASLVLDQLGRLPLSAREPWLAFVHGAPSHASSRKPEGAECGWMSGAAGWKVERVRRAAVSARGSDLDHGSGGLHLHLLASVLIVASVSNGESEAESGGACKCNPTSRAQALTQRLSAQVPLVPWGRRSQDGRHRRATRPAGRI